MDQERICGNYPSTAEYLSKQRIFSVKQSSEEAFVEAVWILKLVSPELFLFRTLDKRVDDKNRLLGLLRRMESLTEREPGPEERTDELVRGMLQVTRLVERDEDWVRIGDRSRQGHRQQEEVGGKHFF